MLTHLNTILYIYWGGYDLLQSWCWPLADIVSANDSLCCTWSSYRLGPQCILLFVIAFGIIFITVCLEIPDHNIQDSYFAWKSGRSLLLDSTWETLTRSRSDSQFLQYSTEATHQMFQPHPNLPVSDAPVITNFSSDVGWTDLAIAFPGILSFTNVWCINTDVISRLPEHCQFSCYSLGAVPFTKWWSAESKNRE